MRQLMISLDKKILDPTSAVAQRMIEYGKENELFIIIPNQKKIAFDLSNTVHAQTTGGNKIQQYFRLKKLGRKIVQSSEFRVQSSLITAQDPFFTGRVGVYLKKKTGLELEVQLHGDFYSTDYYKKSGFKNWIQYQIGRKVIKKADKLRVVGERIKQNLTKFNKIDENKIEVRPIVVDKEKIGYYEPVFDLHKKYPEYKNIFLALGRLEPVKNISWLVNAFKEVVKQKSDYLLLIVGNGKEELDIRLQVTCCKLQENVRFEDWTDDPISYIKTADCVLFPSLSEGYGLVPMEANAVGTPIIMNDVGVANYELKPSEKVKIIPVTDKQAWINAILTV